MGTVGMLGDSKLCDCEGARLFVLFVSVWPCDGLSTHPECALSRPMAAGIGSSAHDPELYQAVTENGSMDICGDRSYESYKSLSHNGCTISV